MKETSTPTRRTFGGIYVIADEERFQKACQEDAINRDVPLFGRLGRLESRVFDKQYRKLSYQSKAVDEWLKLSAHLGLVYAGKDHVAKLGATREEQL